jgi:hypothetical protein
MVDAQPTLAFVFVAALCRRSCMHTAALGMQNRTSIGHFAGQEHIAQHGFKASVPTPRELHPRPISRQPRVGHDSQHPLRTVCRGDRIFRPDEPFPAETGQEAEWEKQGREQTLWIHYCGFRPEHAFACTAMGAQANLSHVAKTPTHATIQPAGTPHSLLVQRYHEKSNAPSCRLSYFKIRPTRILPAVREPTTTEQH